MLDIHFLPFQNLETPRLLLRQVNVDDADAIMLLRGNTETMQFIPRPLVKSREEALEHIAMITAKIENNEGINWAITLKGTLEFVGIIGHYRIQPQNYRAEIGYMLLPEFHGKGFATEAINAALLYGFETMKLHSIEAVIDPGNIASEKVLQKNGFVKEAHILENEYYDGKFLDTVIYSILERNFKK